MEKLDKLRQASSSFGERLKTSGVQMSRMFSTKMKEILQAPTPESKMVDEATLETMEEPNWGLNLRICKMINSEELSGTEIVKAIKRKLSGKSSVSQRLSLDLLEVFTSNCEKVFSAVASEKVLDDMVRIIDDPKVEYGIRRRAFQLIRGWGESEDLMYLPVFHQTYLNIKGRAPLEAEDEHVPPTLNNSLGSFMDQDLISPPQQYPMPDGGLYGTSDPSFPPPHGIQSVEEYKVFLVVSRNSLDLLSSILNSETEPKPIKEDLTVSLLENCKESLPVVQRIAETTTDDEAMLFEALNLHDELQQVISRYNKIEAAVEVAGQPPLKDVVEPSAPVEVGDHRETEEENAGKGIAETSNEMSKVALSKENV